MRQSTIEKVESMLRRECEGTGVFYCSNRGGARMSGVVKGSFKRVVEVSKKTKGLKTKRVSYHFAEYRF